MALPNPKYVPVPDAVKEWATEIEKKYIDAYNRLQSYKNVGKELKVDAAGVRRSIQAAIRRASKYGYSPDHNMKTPVPEGQMVKGISYLLGEDGKPKLTWVKTKLDDQAYLEMLQDTLIAFTDEFRGKSQLVPIPEYTVKDLMVTYEVADPHVGLYAWEEEAGAAFDLVIAEELLVATAKRLVDSSPNAELGVVEILGDFFHADNTANMTTKRGNLLDVDTRYSKVLGVGIRCARTVVELALKKHKKVKIIVAIGNHDDHTALMLSHVLAAYYCNNPRVELIQNNSKFYYYQHGKVMIGITHGDTVKPKQLAQIMATDRPQMWGETLHRYWHTGHIHIKTVQEEPGCTIESFNSVVAADYWTHSSGYRAGRSMTSITYHNQFGEVERHRVDISQLKDVKRMVL